MRHHCATLAVLAAAFPHLVAQTPPGAQAPPSPAPAPESPAPPVQAEGPSIVLPGMRKLTITGQYRLRYESHVDFDFDSSRGINNDFFTQRVRLNFEPEFNDTLSALIQLQDAREWGEETNTLDDSADGIDLHQAHVKVRDLPGIGGSSKLGRQSIELGDQRLVSSLEWPSAGRAFDGLRHTWGQPAGYTLDAFFFQTREIRNAKNDDALFGGLYGSGHPLDGSTADLYAMMLHNDEASGGGGAENRLTLGTRWVQTMGDLELGTEIATQVGEIGGADIPIGETAAAHVHATYRLQDCALKPFATLEANWASGNSPGNGDNERFDTLFAFPHFYFGYIDFVEWENIQHAGAVLGGQPWDSTKIGVYWHFFRSAEETDEVSGPNGKLSSGAAGRSQTLGHELDLKVTVALDTKPVKTMIEAGYAVFFPGPATVDEKGADDLAHFFYLQGDLRF